MGRRVRADTDGDAAALAADAAGVPASAITVVTMPELPRLATGKPDVIRDNPRVREVYLGLGH